MITGKTRLNAVIGFPIGHSKSPALHNALYQKLGIDAVMLAFAHNNLKNLISAIKTLNIGLAAVTMPFKQSVMPFLDKIDKTAKKINSVNTIINKNGKLFGYNTDIDGIARALKGVVIRNKIVLVLGAGGAARAIAYYIKMKKGKLAYINRTKTKASILQKDFGGRIASLKALQSAQIIINATPIGMHPKVKASPLSKKFLRKTQVVFDLVYNPAPTQLLKDAKTAGAKTVSGTEMFAGQALRQIELFTNKKLSNPRLTALAVNLLIKT